MGNFQGIRFFGIGSFAASAGNSCIAAAGQPSMFRGLEGRVPDPGAGLHYGIRIIESVVDRQ